MIKHFLAIFLLISTIYSTHSQTYYIPTDTLYQGCQPDSVHLFLFGDSLKSTSYTYDTIPYYTVPVGGTFVSLTDDATSGALSVGFDVSWFCGSYSQFYINSNGWIRFGNPGAPGNCVFGCFAPTTIPNLGGGTPRNAVMGVWRDWHPGIAGGPYITYQTLGTAPNRKLVVTWNAVPMFSCTTTYGTFQIVVHETSNIIHTNITNMPTCLGWANGDGTHGIHDPNGTYGVPVTGRNDTPFTTTNESLRFLPTSPINWTLANGQQVGIGNDLYTSVLQSTYAYATAIQCDGDTVVDSVYIASSCINLIVDSVDVQCTGDSSGWIIAQDTSTALNAPYTYYYINQATGDTIGNHPSSNTTDTLLNVPAGTYTVVCASSTEFAVGTTIVNEPAIVPAFTSMIPVLCNGTSTGKAIAIDTNDYAGLGWDGFYSYEWSNGNTTINSTNNSDTLDNLPAGVYNVTIDGCLIQTGTVTVTEPTILQATIINQTATSCPGVLSCDASAQAMGFGGVVPYSYQWSSGETTQIANALCPDTNWVTITDANGCDTSAFVIIDVPDSIITTGFGDTLICISNSASIIATSIGGTSPFSYTWSIDSLEGDTVGNLQNILVNPIIDKRYFAYSIDANGCLGDTASVLVKVRPELGVELPYLDTICPYDDIDIEVAGVGGDSIYTYSWSSGQFGSLITVSPDLPTWYYLTVSDACGTPTYLDSVYVQVGGYSDIKAKIEVTDDSLCQGENVVLTAVGLGGFRGPDEYRFKWSKASWGSNSIQSITPQTTQDYIITISDLCISKPGLDTVTIYVGDKVFPEYGANPEASCKEADVQLFVEEYNDQYTYNWILGDENSILNAKNDTISHGYDNEGCYNVQLEVITDFGCKSLQMAECLVNILQSPVANFKNDPNNPSNLEPIVHFTDASKNGFTYNWLVDSTSVSIAPSFKYEFGDTGVYEVQLAIVASNGCKDTITKYLHNYLETILYFPGSFSPNGDGLNDKWGLKGEGIDINNFELEIFDRWGHSLFYTTDPEDGWDGYDKSTGGYIQSGSYGYIVHYLDKFNEPKVITGQIVISNSGVQTGLR